MLPRALEAVAVEKHSPCALLELPTMLAANAAPRPCSTLLGLTVRMFHSHDCGVCKPAGTAT